MNRADLAAAIDHTLLGPAASEDGVDRLCEEAMRFGAASVCVNPRHAARARARLADSHVKLCVVIGFPHGMTTTPTKVFEAREAIEAGAEELDMVIPVGALKDGDDDAVRADISAVCEAAHGSTPRAIVKVILETCLLTDDEKRRAAALAEAAGADFVKTSTGFAAGGATEADVRLLRASVGPRVSVKAAGGIRDTATALAMIAAGASRIGASRTADILSGVANDAAGSPRR